MGNDSEKVYTADDLARRLQVSKATVYRMARLGEIPCVRIGRLVRFPARVIERWLAEQAQQADRIEQPAGD